MLNQLAKLHAFMLEKEHAFLKDSVELLSSGLKAIVPSEGDAYRLVLTLETEMLEAVDALRAFFTWG